MKHVIVIETPDEYGVLAESLEDRINWEVEKMIPVPAFVHSTFNYDSAISAVHDMYNAPKWINGRCAQ